MSASCQWWTLHLESKVMGKRAIMDSFETVWAIIFFYHSAEPPANVHTQYTFTKRWRKGAGNHTRYWNYGSFRFKAIFHRRERGLQRAFKNARASILYNIERELTNNVISDLEEKIKKSLESSESQVNFTTDMWKCEGQNREYMTVTAHWAVENGEQKHFEMKNALLEVEEFTDSTHMYNIRKSVSINLKYHMF